MSFDFLERAVGGRWRVEGGAHRSLHRVPAARRPWVLAIMLLAASSTACKREERRFTESPPGGAPTAIVRLVPLQAGPAVNVAHTTNPYDENAQAITDGQRLYGWYNCTGCHANGGGGMGPPLMDSTWIYGSEPGQIFRTIVEGRPNGMPSFAGRIPSTQVWQIVAYIRSMSALTPSAARSARTDHMMYQPGSQTLATPQTPKQSSVPQP